MGAGLTDAADVVLRALVGTDRPVCEGMGDGERCSRAAVCVCVMLCHGESHLMCGRHRRMLARRLRRARTVWCLACHRGIVTKPTPYRFLPL